MIQTDAKLAKYQNVAEELRHRIRSGQWLIGDKLPPAGELAEMFGVSRLTALRGLRELANEGFVASYSDPRGTVVMRSEPFSALGLTTLICLFRPLRQRNKSDNYGLDVVEGIRREISDRGYRFIHHSLDEEDYDQRIADVLRSGMGCGVLLDQKTPLPIVQRLTRMGAPASMFNRILSLPNLSCASPDFEAAGRESASLFHEKGYERVAFYHSPPNEQRWGEKQRAQFDQLIRQRRAFFEAARERGYAREDMTPFPSAPNHEAAEEPETFGLPRRKPRGWRPVGIFAVHDGSAVSVMKAVAKTDLALGRDVGVISGIELEVASDNAKQPTTWRVDRHAVGKAAARELLDRIEDQGLPERVVRIPMELLCRGTA